MKKINKYENFYEECYKEIKPYSNPYPSSKPYPSSPSKNDIQKIFDSLLNGNDEEENVL